MVPEPPPKSERESNLALSTVPEDKLVALREVKEAPEPEKVVAVTVPATCNLVVGSVVPTPTFPEEVHMP